MYNGRNQLVDDCSNMEESENYYSTFAVYEQVNLEDIDLTELTNDELKLLIELYDSIINAESDIFKKPVFRGNIIEYVECSNINSIVDAKDFMKNKDKDEDGKEYCKFRIRWKDKLIHSRTIFQRSI